MRVVRLAMGLMVAVTVAVMLVMAMTGRIWVTPVLGISSLMRGMAVFARVGGMTLDGRTSSTGVARVDRAGRGRDGRGSRSRVVVTVAVEQRHLLERVRHGVGIVRVKSRHGRDGFIFRIARIRAGRSRHLS